MAGLRLFVHGGEDGSKALDDLYVLDTQTSIWTKRTPNGRLPSPRARHTLNQVDNKFYLFGGWDKKNVVNTVDILDLTTAFWIQPTITGTFPKVTPARLPSYFS